MAQDRGKVWDVTYILVKYRGAGDLENFLVKCEVLVCLFVIRGLEL